MFLADFHTHTNLSDGQIPMRELVDLHGKKGFGAIAITDHLCESKSILGRASRYLNCSLREDNVQAYLDLIASEAKRAWQLYEMLLIPGFEITMNSISNHRSAHILAIGVNQYINPNQSIPALCEDIRAKGGLAIAAHPVSTRKLEKQTFHLWDRREELKNHFDAWEVASGPYIISEVLESGLPMIASSDMHHKKQLTSWKTVMRCEKDQAAILQAIREQNIEFAFYEEKASAISPKRLKPWSRLGNLFPEACPFPVT